MLFSVRASSVRSGRISLTAPTRVVFPTPNPPATRILTAITASIPMSVAPSERMESIDHFLEYALVGEPSHRRGRMSDDQSVVEEVAEEYPDDPQGEVELGGHLHHRGGGGTEGQDVLVFWAHQQLGGRGDAGGPDHR